MSITPASENPAHGDAFKPHASHSENTRLDITEFEAHVRAGQNPYALVGARTAPKTLGAGSSLGISMFSLQLTMLATSLMEWRGVTLANVFIPNLFFAAGLGMLVTAQWEMAIGNGMSYTAFSGFGLLYVGYGAILSPAFGIEQAYANDMTMFYNAMGLFFILWMIFALALFVASLPTNVVHILIFFFVTLALIFLGATYFSLADGMSAVAESLKKTAGACCFIAGIVGWYLNFAVLLQDSAIKLPLGDTSRYFYKTKSI